MMKRIFALLLSLTMICSLAACGGGSGESSAETPSGDDASASKPNTETISTEPADNVLSIKGGKDATRTAVITFDAEKLEVIDFSRNSAAFELADNHHATIRLMCVDDGSTLEDVYQQEMGNYLEEPDLTVSELTETAVGDLTVLCSDAKWPDGYTAFEFFALEVDNGLIVYSMYMPGHEDPVYLDELLPYVLVDVAVGDDKQIQPAMPYEFKSDGDVLTLTFQSGESFTMDFDQTVIEAYRNGVSASVSQVEGDARFFLDVTNNYTCAEEYFTDKDLFDYLYTDEFFPVESPFESLFVGRFDDDTDRLYVDLGNGYALISEYNPEWNDGQTLEPLLLDLFGYLEVPSPDADTDSSTPAQGATLTFAGPDGEDYVTFTYDPSVIEIVSFDDYHKSFALVKWEENGNSCEAEVSLNYRASSPHDLHLKLGDYYDLNSSIYGDYYVSNEDTRQYGGKEVYMAEYSFSGQWNSWNVECAVGMGEAEFPLLVRLQFVNMEQAYAILEDLLLNVEYLQ